MLVYLVVYESKSYNVLNIKKLSLVRVMDAAGYLPVRSVGRRVEFAVMSARLACGPSIAMTGIKCIYCLCDIT